MVENLKQIGTISEFEVDIAEKSEKVTNKNGSTLWKCKECGRVYKTKDNLASHIENHLEEREIKREAERKDEAENHINELHFKSKCFKSAYETEQIKTLRSEIFNRMEKLHDAEEGTMWKCTECGKILKKKYKLEMHVESHLEGFTHRCVHCDTIHKTRGALRLHISSSHRGEK